MYPILLEMVIFYTRNDSQINWMYFYILYFFSAFVFAECELNGKGIDESDFKANMSL